MRDRLLVVDDEPEILLMTRWALEAHGYEVYTAASAEEAFRYLKAMHPQLLLIDYKLPGASGAKFLEWVRATNLNTPAIMITGLSSQRDSIEIISHQLGAFACLRKPIQMEQLLELIQNALKPKP